MTYMKTLMASASIFAIAACSTVGPDYVAPENHTSIEQSFVADTSVETTASEPAHTWWHDLNDETLNELTKRASAENRTLRQAVANVEATMALLRLERVNLRPQGEIGVSAQRRRIAGASFGVTDQSFPDTGLYTAGASAAWELDFFGRVKRGVEAAYADAEAASALMQDAHVLVMSETVQAYLDYQGAQTQLTVAKRNLDVQKGTVGYTEARQSEGIGTQLDVIRARSQAKLTEAAIPPIEAAIVSAANRLATLTGSSVNQINALLSATDEGLPEPPAAIRVGDPSSLIERRADVRAAERAFAAATARIGVAKADYFPSISLTGNVAVSAQSISNVDSGNAFGYSIGPTLSWGGFDLGRVRAQVDAAGSSAEAALAAYEQTVFSAIEETQTTLADYGREKVRFDLLSEAADDAAEAAQLARVRFEDGVDDFIDVLDAEGRQLQAEAALAESRTAVTKNYAAIYRALGAGWAQ